MQADLIYEPIWSSLRSNQAKSMFGIITPHAINLDLEMTNFDTASPNNTLPDLPPNVDLETPSIFRETIHANRLLGELKGFCQTLPNPKLLLNTIALQESKESSAIENIVTTQDELYAGTLMGTGVKNEAVKEVIRYREALYWGLEQMQQNGLLTTNMMVGIMQQLRGTNEAVRQQPGIKLLNPGTGNIVYTPPEGEAIIRSKLAALEHFINVPEVCTLDPLIKMALIHYQFEAIHPFSDGNGRTGRILNILYLIQQDLLTLPVLYLSKYILEHKNEYYRLLREVTEMANWQEWVVFIVKGIALTAQLTLSKIRLLLNLMSTVEQALKPILGQAYSKELIELLFSYPYIKIAVLEEYQIAKRQAASKYLQKIQAAGWLQAIKQGRETYYVNHRLLEVLSG